MTKHTDLWNHLKIELPGDWFIKTTEFIDVPVVVNEKPTLVYVDAPGLMYVEAPSLSLLAQASIKKLNNLLARPDTCALVFAHDGRSGSPSAKYCKDESEDIIETPLMGWPEYFKRFERINGNVSADLQLINPKQAMHYDYPLPEKFGEKLFTNRQLKEWVAEYICKVAFIEVVVPAGKWLYVSGPNYSHLRVGNREVPPDPALLVPYYESDYYAAYIANIYSNHYNVVIYSRDADTVLATTLSRYRFGTHTTDRLDGCYSLADVKFKNTTLVVLHWQEKLPLTYVDINKFWLAIQTRMAALSCYRGENGVANAVPTFISLLLLTGNDYVVQLPFVTPARLMKVFRLQFKNLALPFTREGNDAADFRMNCDSIMQLIMLVYGDAFIKRFKTNKIEYDPKDYAKAVEHIRPCLAESQREKFTLGSLYRRCANVCWFMRYMIAAQKGKLPDESYIVDKNNVSLYGYELVSPELTKHGWMNMRLTDDVTLEHFNFETENC